MDRLSKLVTGIALAVACISGHAGYAQLAPPPSFAPMPAAAPIARYGYAAANDASWVAQTVRTTASLNVGGQAVKVPVAMRLAANAPRFAAQALMFHPGIRVAAGMAAWIVAAGIIYSPSLDPEKSWAVIDKTIDQQCLPNSWGNMSGPAFCSYAFGGSSTGTIVASAGSCKYSCTTSWGIDDHYSWPANITTGGTLRPLTKEEYEQKMAPEVFRPGTPSIMPESVPNELPSGTPLPVEQPIINPTPGDNPRPQPYFVPTGNPVPNPNYDPNAAPSPENQPYFQPGVRIVPSPTLDDPWRVDVQPVNRPTSSPDPKSVDDLNPTPATNPDPAQDPAKDDKPKDEDKQDLCEKHPEILACQKLDEPENKELEQTTKDISITPDGGWGADNATCPAPKILHIQGREVAIPYDLFCTYMSGIRPIVLAMAWLTAAFILIGVRETS